ncbi:D-alanyl-D-alanine carboxypeptidase family protein [Microbaculum marinum]
MSRARTYSLEARRGLVATLSSALVALVILAILPSHGRAGPALVFDTRTGEVLHSYGAFTPWHPASLTKLMTAYVSFQAIRQGSVSLQTPVRISANALAQPPSKMGFAVGTEISLEYALRILMVKSANDIAVAVAETVGGSEPAFISMMNNTARRLGMTDTYYVNPHGLHDPQQRTTARDLAFLTRALIRDFPQYQGFFELASIQVGQSVLRNHNKLIGRFRGADGMKTGYVCASGFNIVATATRGGRRLAAVVMGGMSGAKRDEVTEQLLEAAFQTGGGFSLFGSGRPNIDSLRRPATVGPPVDVRDYVCLKKTPPAEIASFGMEATAVAAGGDPSAIVGASAAGTGSALALTSAQVINLGAVASPAEPAVAFDVPLPRPRPSSTAVAPGVAPLVQSAPSQPAGIRPLPNPLR